MQFTFETNITESKGAVNTAAKIAEILKETKVKFSTLKEPDGVPGIWATLPGEEKARFIAKMSYDKPDNYDDKLRYRQYGAWWTVYPRDPHGDGEEVYLFNYTTDAAKKLILEWINSLCDEYENRLAADEIPDNG